MRIVSELLEEQRRKVSGDKNKDVWGNFLYNVKTYGAKGDGVGDDTDAFMEAFSDGDEIAIPPGTYKLGQITIPSTVKSVKGYGNVKLIPSSDVSTSAAISWITALSLSDAEISGITFEVDSTTYPNLRCLDLTLCTNVLVERVRAIKGGGIAIYGAQCNFVTVRKCKVDTFAIKGISFDGAQQSNINIVDNVVTGSGSAHCISAQLGSFLKIKRNYCTGASTFGVGLYQVSYCTIVENSISNTGKEGINIEDSSYVKIDDNTCKWDTGIGTDFGISVYGAAVATQFNSITNNTVVNSYAAGVTLADNVSFCHVDGNEVFGTNRGKIANQAGILLYGSNCLKNTVTDNVVVDIAGNYNYAISEYNFGTGAPSLNEITGNYIEGYVIGDILRTDTTTVIALNNKDLEGFRSYTPTVAASSGTVTTSTANGYYVQLGKMIFFYARVTITTNGTGAGALRVGLPFIAVRGSGSGKELATSGKALSVEINSNPYVEVRAYDNTYPAVDGSIIDVTGLFQTV